MPARLFLPVLLATAAACAQAASPAGAPLPPPGAAVAMEEQALDPRHNQKIERIHLEDAGNVIDEVRYGGQTQSITVQPKVGVPAYEVQPPELSRTRPGDNREGLSSAGGQRSWNLLRF